MPTSNTRKRSILSKSTHNRLKTIKRTYFDHGSEYASKNPPQEVKYDFKKPGEFLAYARSLRALPDFGYSNFRELIELMEQNKMKIIHGQPVVYVDGFNENENKTQPAHKVYGVILIDRAIPDTLKPFILNHELREQLLEQAGYSQRVAHFVARRKELRDLTSRGTLDHFMEYLRERYPLAYRERVRAWNYHPTKKKPKIN